MSTEPTALPASIRVLPGQMFDHYRIEQEIGRGGMGAVYRARDTRLNRDVAFKICTLADNAEARERFRREAQVVASLHHTNLCPVYDFVERDGLAYIAMAYVDGVPLSAWAKAQSPGVPAVARLVTRVARAMQRAHDAGIVHRDLKPGNVLIDRTGEPIVVDFGLARQMSDTQPRLTQAGSIYGTPSYMAPEQLRDPTHAGQSVDVYALGVILYELLTGKLPIQAQDVWSLVGQIMTQVPDPPSKSNPAVGPSLDAVCLRALAKTPEERFRSMTAFADALEAAAAGLAPPVHAAHPTITEVRPSSPDAATPGAPPRSAVRLVTMLVVLAGIVGLVIFLLPKSRRDRLEVPVKGGDKLVMDFLRVPGGSFLMGSHRPGLIVKGDKDHAPDEEEHTVELTGEFWLSRTEVTRGQFRAFVADTDYETDAEKAGESRTWKRPGFDQTDEHPVVCVSWNDATAFCNWLRQKTGKPYRLPTEAEWEGACRGESRRKRFGFGDDERQLGNYAWFAANAEGKTHPVAAKTANVYGLHDLHGNVREWCQDWYDEKYYLSSPKRDPQGPESGTTRALRGGGWGDAASGCRSACRYKLAPDKGGDSVGFRVCLRAE